MRQNVVFATILMIGLTTLTSAGLAKPKSQASTTGKEGWVTIQSNTQVGNQTLLPGTYYFSDNVQGNDHYLSFQQLGDPDLAFEYSDQGTIGQPINVRVTSEALPSQVKKTRVTTVPDGAKRRITSVAIKGESAAFGF